MPTEFQTTTTTITTVDPYDQDTLLVDDCEGATAWTNSGTGADYSSAEAALANYIGSKGLQMKTRVTTPAEDDYVQSKRFVCYPGDQSVRLRLRFCVQLIAVVKDFQQIIEFCNGTNAYKLGIKYDNELHKLYYWSSAGSWTEITGYGFTIANGQWFALDLKFSITDKEYTSIKLAGLETSLAGVAIQTGAGSTKKEMTLALIATALTTTQCRVDVDTILLQIPS
jgi:hypothetical protein